MKKNFLSTGDYSAEELEKIIKLAIGYKTGTAKLPNFEDKILSQISRDIASISGQKPKVTRARKSIAGFKIRQGQIVGLQVTLRGQRMVDFFDRLIKIVLPRVRDFNGIDPKSVDGGGVLNIGLKEQFVFPEIDGENSPVPFSLGINVVPKFSDRSRALSAYEKLGVPFKKPSLSRPTNR